MNITNTVIFPKSARWSVINTLVFKYHNCTFIKWEILCVYIFFKKRKIDKNGINMHKKNSSFERDKLRTSRKSDNDPYYQGAMHLP